MEIAGLSPSQLQDLLERDTATEPGNPMAGRARAAAADRGANLCRVMSAIGGSVSPCRVMPA
jgi:hypothetical protein